MNGPVAQCVALTCHANAFLQGRIVPPFSPGNSTCTFCDWIKFFGVSKSLWGKIREEGVASSPDAWFAYLKAANVSAIRLSRPPQNQDSGVLQRFRRAVRDGGRTRAPRSDRRLLPAPVRARIGCDAQRRGLLAHPYRRQHFNLFSEDWQRRQSKTVS
jgi:hypothetical protein